MPQSMGFPATDRGGSLGGTTLLRPQVRRLLAFHPHWMLGQLDCYSRDFRGGIPLKLEKDLVREILIAVEAHNEAHGWMELTIEGRTPIEVSYHVMLLDEAGFLSGISLGGINHSEWQPRRLTYKGHEFLDTVRDPEVWRRTKDGAEKAGVAGLGMLLELGKAYGKQLLKERLGLELP